MQKFEFLCVFGLIATSFASPHQQTRYRRQSNADKVKADTGLSDAGNAFGAGAAAGVGGLGRSAGIGSFSANPSNDPYRPFGAFAGLNLGQGNGDKIGAGCSGLNCGFQLGNLALSTRQLFDAFANANANGNSNGNGNGRQHMYRRRNGNWFNNENRIDARDNYSENPYGMRYANRYQTPMQSNDAFRYNGLGQFTNNNYRLFSSPNFDPLRLLQQPLNMLQQFQNQYRQQQQQQKSPETPINDHESPYPDNEQHQQPSVSEFARFGNNLKNGLFSGSAFSSTFGSADGNPPVYQSTSVHMDEDGKVTTVQRGSGVPDKVTTGRIGDNGSNGVFAASATKVDSDGNVSSVRNVGSLK